ncbi:MAG: PilZ domain-containing protein [Gemmataceae bacterium]|nr:PilZ domain-containing protein [Gemmataceae bacterium]
MSTLSAAAIVQPVRNPYFRDMDCRSNPRHACALEATSHPLDMGETLSWGAVVSDISAGGLAVTLCYPFKPGTYLSVDLQSPGGMVRTLMVRVLHVHDRKDGQWHLGCEFLKPLTQIDMDVFV